MGHYLDSHPYILSAPIAGAVIPMLLAERELCLHPQRSDSL